MDLGPPGLSDGSASGVFSDRNWLSVSFTAGAMLLCSGLTMFSMAAGGVFEAAMFALPSILKVTTETAAKARRPAMISVRRLLLFVFAAGFISGGNFGLL